MSLSKYNKHFGGGRGSAAKALRKMQETYGPRQGKAVFDGLVAKKEHRGKRK